MPKPPIRTTNPTGAKKPLDKQTQVTSLFDGIAKHYDFLNRTLSLRQDIRWRKALIAWIPESSHSQHNTLVDVATGTGDVLFLAIKRLRSYSHYHGFDLSNNMLRVARKKAERLSQSSKAYHPSHASPISFKQANACHIPMPEASVHCLTIAFGLRNIEKRTLALQEFARLLSPGSSLLVLEFFPSRVTIFAKLFRLYFYHILPRLAGLFSKRKAYEYLPRSVDEFVSPLALRDECKAQGLTFKRERSFMFGSCYLMEFCKDP